MNVLSIDVINTLMFSSLMFIVCRVCIGTFLNDFVKVK
jgi:hypothetical protein